MAYFQPRSGCDAHLKADFRPLLLVRNKTLFLDQILCDRHCGGRNFHCMDECLRYGERLKRISEKSLRALAQGGLDRYPWKTLLKDGYRYRCVSCVLEFPEVRRNHLLYEK